MDYFPIFRLSTHVFSQDEMINYLKTFPMHKITLRNVRSDEDDVYYFKTLHEYKCNLTIEVFWKSTYEFLKFNYLVPFKTFLDLLENKQITIEEIIIVDYSSPFINTAPKKDVVEQFFLLKKRREKPLSKKEYEEFEFRTNDKINLPESFFEHLIHEITCLIKFEEYLKNKNMER